MSQSHAAREPTPLASLYQDHHAWLLSWLRRKTQGLHHAQDVAQETFCKLLGMAPADLRQLHNGRAFLVTTASRLLIDQSRRDAIERAYLEGLAHTLQHHHMPSAEQQAQTLELLVLIGRMLDGLPDKPRQAFLMSRLDGMLQVDIAARLGVSPSMVKQYIVRVMVHCYAIVYGDHASA